MSGKDEITAEYGCKENSSIIKVIGVGGGGSNAVRQMYSEGIVGVDFLICNTDHGHLDKSPIREKLLLGAGLGAGATPDVARQFAVEKKNEIREFIGETTKMLFITAGMGKGTGTGASPIIAEIAKEMGILTIGVVTYPFNFEGKKRKAIAEKGIEELNKYVDSLIIVRNQNLFSCYTDALFEKAYKYADDVLKNAVKCIAELITVNYFQNVDFNDVQTIMKNSGKAMLGIATAKGEDRINNVFEDALNCPLLDNAVINDANNFLFFLSYGEEANFTMQEFDQLTQRFENLCSDDANIIWGQGKDSTLGDSIKLSVILTNFNTEQKTTSVILDNTKIEINDNTPEGIGEKIVLETVATPNDIDHLTSSNSGSDSMESTLNYEFSENNVSPNIQKMRSISQNSAMGTFSIEAQSDPLYNTEKSFEEMMSTPAIFRQQNARAKAMTATQTAAIMDSQSHHAIANDMCEFFTDIAD